LYSDNGTPSSNNPDYNRSTNPIQVAIEAKSGDGKRKVQIDYDGFIFANHGQVGGWTINDTTLFGGGTTLNSDGTITCRNLQASIDGKIGGWHIGTTKLSSESGHIDLNNNGSIISDAWNIQPNGVATFTDVRISSPNSSSTLDWGSNFGVTGDGRMHALAGQIGGWTLDSSGFKGAGIQITPNALTYGDNFHVTPSGNVTARNLTAEGTGTIGGCTISGGTLSANGLRLNGTGWGDISVYTDLHIGGISEGTVVYRGIDYDAPNLDGHKHENSDGSVYYTYSLNGGSCKLTNPKTIQYFTTLVLTGRKTTYKVLGGTQVGADTEISRFSADGKD